MSIERLAKRLRRIEADIRASAEVSYDRADTGDAWQACLRAIEYRQLDDDDFEAVFRQHGPLLRAEAIQRARARRVERLTSNEPELPFRPPYQRLAPFPAAVEILSYRPDEQPSRAAIWSLRFWSDLTIGMLSFETEQIAKITLEWFEEQLAVRTLGPNDGIELRTAIWNQSGCISTPLTALGTEHPNPSKEPGH